MKCESGLHLWIKKIKEDDGKSYCARCGLILEYKIGDPTYRLYYRKDKKNKKK